MANPFLQLLQDVRGLEQPNIYKSELPEPLSVTAVFSVHGMGQQVRFETLERLAKSLHDEHRIQTNLDSTIHTRVVQMGEKKVIRTEMKLGDRDVHVYEGYWAPLTEGRVTLKDAFDFLNDAGKSGLKHLKREKGVFKRWVFGALKPMPESNVGRLRFLFYFILGLLGAMAVINASLLVFVGGNLFGPAAVWPTAEMEQDIAIDSLLYLVPAALLGIGFYFQSKRYHQAIKAPDGRHDPKTWKAMQSAPNGPTRQLFWFLIWMTMIMIVVAAVAFIGHAYYHREREPGVAWWTSFTGLEPADWLVPALPFLIAASFIITAKIAFLVREWMIQYVGDLAAYISAYKVSKFFEIRDRIQDQTCTVIRSIFTYRAKGSAEPLYDRFIVVGHSLGSVVAYDSLNSVINDHLVAVETTEDPQEKEILEKYSPIERTKLLLTCGSPLDKTAFIFRSQVSEDMNVREEAAAQVQPSIRDYAFRPFPWINIWSDQDPISGPLEFYDDPDQKSHPQRVRNWMDVQASLPFAAHSHYFDHPLLRDTLYQAVMRGSATGPHQDLVQGPAGAVQF